jgi:hypothetical protein
MTENEALVKLYDIALEIASAAGIAQRSIPAPGIIYVSSEKYYRLCDALHNAALFNPNLPEDK